MIEINKSFYQKANNYNNDIYQNYEQDIIKYIENYNRKDYNKIIEQDKRTNIVTIFSEMRANIIKWYLFDKNKNVLEVGANYGEITYELSQKCKNVTSIEFSETKANCISRRLEDVTNVQILLCTNLKDIKLEEKYDYITLIGTAEYAKQLGFKDLQEMIKWANDNLKQDGKILLAIDNKFGVKYLAGSTRNKQETVFANYRGHVEKDYQLYGKTELEQILNNIENIKYKFYYPVPNYSLTHLIYTDEYLPQQSRYNIYYREDEEILYEELSFIEQAIRNKKFDFFTNSYLIEIAKQEVELDQTKFVNYSNMRKSEYKIITQISKENVTKQAYTEKGKQHIEQIRQNIEKLKQLGFITCEKENENKIESSFIEKPTMDEYLKRLLEQDKVQEFINELDKWYNFIKNKVTLVDNENTIFEKYQISAENKNELTFIKEGFIDLIFQNVFYDGNEYILFDQEWYEENIPLEYIMYRAIKQLFFVHNELNKKIDKQEIYQKHNITKFIDIFEKIEDIWQQQMVDQTILNFYSDKWSRIISIEDIKFKYNQEYGKLYSERDLEKESLQEKIKELQKEKQEIVQVLEDMKNGSRLYRWVNFFKKDDMK